MVYIVRSSENHGHTRKLRRHHKFILSERIIPGKEISAVIRYFSVWLKYHAEHTITMVQSMFVPVAYSGGLKFSCSKKMQKDRNLGTFESL